MIVMFNFQIRKYDIPTYAAYYHYIPTFLLFPRICPHLLHFHLLFSIAFACIPPFFHTIFLFLLLKFSYLIFFPFFLFFPFFIFFLFLAEALALLRAHLPPNAILVGQSILKDVQWLQLAEGVDYYSLIDLSALFRVWNQQRGQYTNFSQDHCAKVWIGVGERAHHNAIEDAAISMSLFNAYRMVQWEPNRLYQMQMATLSSPRIPGKCNTSTYTTTTSQ